MYILFWLMIELTISLCIAACNFMSRVPAG